MAYRELLKRYGSMVVSASSTTSALQRPYTSRLSQQRRAKSMKFGIRIGLKSYHGPASLRTVASALRQQLIADKSKFLGIR